MNLVITLRVPAHRNWYPGMNPREISELEEAEFKEHPETLLQYIREHVDSVQVRVQGG